MREFHIAQIPACPVPADSVEVIRVKLDRLIGGGSILDLLCLLHLYLNGPLKGAPIPCIAGIGDHCRSAEISLGDKSHIAQAHLAG